MQQLLLLSPNAKKHDCSPNNDDAPSATGFSIHLSNGIIFEKVTTERIELVVTSNDKSKTNTYKELIALIHAKSIFELDWQLTEETLESTQFAYQEKVYRHYRENAYEAFLVLGFSDKSVVTSESLRYLRLIAATFVKKLAMNP